MERSPRKSNFYLNYICLSKRLLSIKHENADEVMKQAGKVRQESITSPGIPQLAACPYHSEAVMCFFTENQSNVGSQLLSRNAAAFIEVGFGQHLHQQRRPEQMNQELLLRLWKKKRSLCPLKEGTGYFGILQGSC